MNNLMHTSHLSIITDTNFTKNITIGDNGSAYESFLVFANKQDTTCKVSIQLEGKNATGHAQIIAISHSSHAVHVDGKISIEEKGDGANAKLSQEIIAIGDSLHTIAKPVLDVKNNNVLASHGAKIHRVDNNQLFYLTSRGLSSPQALSLILTSIIANIVEKHSTISFHHNNSEIVMEKTDDFAIWLTNLITKEYKYVI